MSEVYYLRRYWMDGGTDVCFTSGFIFSERFAKALFDYTVTGGRYHRVELVGVPCELASARTMELDVMNEYVREKWGE